MYKYFFKRLFDIAVSFFLIIILSPIFIITSIAIVLDSKGPIIYIQERCGKNLKTFKVLKFRSMYNFSDINGPLYTIPGDKRVTKVGVFIRKFSVDELPQLFNVLIGNMSLVGPRPDIFPKEVTKNFRIRCSVKPGITGLAQVNGRSNLSKKKRMEYDLSYSNKISFFLDMKILIKTAYIVFKRKGAN